MNIFLSNKLIFFSFWLIILVVLLHSTVNVDSIVLAGDIFGNIQRFISFGLCQIAVPLFFIISGYLFFFKVDNINSVFSNMLKRKKSLLYPYLLWCILWVIFIFFIQSIPLIKSFFGTPLISMGIGDLFKQFFYFPLNYPFWFLRELMLFVLVTPLIYIFSRNKNILFLTVVFLLSLFYKTLLPIKSIDISIFSTGSFFYFLLGSFIGINKYLPIWKLSRSLIIVLLIIWLLSNIIYINLNEVNDSIKVLFLHFKNLVGIIAAWQLYDFSAFSRKPPLSFYKYSFFIFAFHGIPIVYIGYFLKFILPDSPFFHFAIYLFSFVLVVLFSTFIAILTDKYFNRFYQILTGRR